MKQSLKNYLSQMNQTVSALERADTPRDAAQLCRLLARHRDAVAAYQHERWVHLIVTLFFAFLLVSAFAGTLYQPTPAFFVLDAIIGVTLLCYIAHYYFLENNVQKLYPITETLHLWIEEAGKKS